MPLISYAQNAEDIVLYRLFREQPFGRYVDVGASHPEFDSVTKLFYERGWRGVNIEPSPAEFELLCAARPEDVNLAVAVGRERGSATLYLGSSEQRGLGSLNASVAEVSIGAGASRVEVPLVTLSDLAIEHVHGPVDFLKIDVEGFEIEVIEGNDWEAFAPRVVVVEATAPNSEIQTHLEWEPILLGAGYRCALFDGLNRFYAKRNDEEALAVLAVPANVHDGYIRNEMTYLRRHVEQLEARNLELELHARLQEDRIALFGIAERAYLSQETPVWYQPGWEVPPDEVR